MAQRPIFLPAPDQFPFVRTIAIDFTWYAGFAKSQAQKSIQSLHAAAAALGIAPVLEISSKSSTALGVALSAFNLSFQHQTHRLTVESAFQGSKIFQLGGPFQDLYTASSRAAKTDTRLKASGDLIGFRFFDLAFPTQPATAFYDWLYIHALAQNLRLASQVSAYPAFSDIAFNPKLSWNCQARAAALFVALKQMQQLEHIIKDRDYYLQVISTPDPT